MLNQTSTLRTVMNLKREVFFNGFLKTEKIYYSILHITVYLVIFIKKILMKIIFGEIIKLFSHIVINADDIK